MASRLRRRIPTIFAGVGSVSGSAATSAVGVEVTVTLAWTIPAGTYTVGTTFYSNTAGQTYDVSQHVSDVANVGVYSITSQSKNGVAGSYGFTVNADTGVISIPSNLATPASTTDNYSVTVALSASNAAEQDWIARSTGPGVVWAHDFRYDAELTQFLWTDQGPKRNGIAPRLVSDYPVGTAGRALECMTIGATLTANFGTSDTSATFDDLTDWPSGDFYFVMGGNPNAGRAYQNGVSYNRFYCPPGGRSGNTLTGLTLDTTNLWATLTATRQAWLAGDNGGLDVQTAWVRTFAALSSGNGLPAGDINNAGVTARAWPTGGIRSNGAFATWGFGYYGHPDYQDRTWTSSMATASGSVTHGDCWDGDEFYLQMRVKVDPRFWDNHVPADTSSTIWTHKLHMIQTQQSSTQQLATFLPSKNKFYVPGNSNAPFAWFEHTTNNPLLIGGSFQPGGSWASTANFTGTPKAATGQATPDGSSAWGYGTDWVTLLFRVIPGHHLTNDTFLEVKAARRDGSYFTIWSGTATIGFSEAMRSSPAPNDLPGYCALFLTSFLNIDLTVSQNQIPAKSHFKRWTQIILSKQPIPAPAVGA